MNRVLLVLSTGRESPKSIERAIELTSQDKGELFILLIIDNLAADTVVKKLSEEGWIGGDPSKDVYNALQEVYMLQAEDRLKEIEETVDNYEIKHSSIIKKGNFENEVINTINKRKIDIAIITRKKRSQISRIIFGSAVDNIKKRAKCKLEILEE